MHSLLVIFVVFVVWVNLCWESVGLPVMTGNPHSLGGNLRRLGIPGATYDNRKPRVLEAPESLYSNECKNPVVQALFGE